MKNTCMLVAVIITMAGCVRTDESFHKDDLTPQDLKTVERREVGQNFFVRMPAPEVVYHNGVLVKTGGYQWVAVYGWEEQTKAAFDAASDIISIDDYLAGNTTPAPRAVVKPRIAPALISRHEAVGLVEPVDQPDWSQVLPRAKASPAMPAALPDSAERHDDSPDKQSERPTP